VDLPYHYDQNLVAVLQTAVGLVADASFVEEAEPFGVTFVEEAAPFGATFVEEAAPFGATFVAYVVLGPFADVAEEQRHSE
jgi:hypothetical protein